jgi:hypothetical protein
MSGKLAAALTVIVLLLPATAGAAATFAVFSGDAAGEGFNDPTPAAPVGGNPGTTVGLQRQFAFLRAAQIWGATLTSTQVIRVLAFFDPLACTATSAVLGSAAPFFSVRDFPPNPGFPGLIPGTWYPGALGEKRTGFDISTLLGAGNNFDLFAFFNSRLGQAGCLQGGGWYYGLDTNTPAGQINLVTVLLHEFGHGLGFTVGPTSSRTGVRIANLPSIWEGFIRDVSSGKRWLDMTSAERAASAINTLNLVWTGLQTLVDLPSVLQFRTEIAINGPNPVRGEYEAQPAEFGPPLTHGGVKDILMPAYDTGGPSLTDGCEPFSSEPQKSVKGRIALIDRGTCTFTTKVKNAQLAGASGAIIVNNTPFGVPSMGGVDPTITIPSVGVHQSLGSYLRELANLSNSGRGGLPVALQLNPVIRAGTSSGFPRLYAPNPFESGSSVSHWDITHFPNQLMEPAINRDLTHQVTPPKDLIFSLLRDIGW